MSNKKVRAALDTRLAQWQAAHPDVKISWENIPSSSQQQKFITVKLVPNTVQNPSVGAYHERYTGDYKLVLRVQNSGKGMGETETLADSIVQFFKRGDEIIAAGISVHIDRSATVRTSFMDGMYVATPIDIPYRSDIITVT